MKNLLIIIMLLAISVAFGQTATNNVINTATLYSTNSPVKMDGYLIVTNGTVKTLTNDSKVYLVNGVRGQTLSVTNIGPVLGSSNVLVFSEGSLTNSFTIP